MNKIATAINIVSCQHTSILGDNYGTSCRHCGKQLSGYGYGGYFGSRLTGGESCIHLYSPLGDESAEYEICIYCERTRQREVTL